MSSLSTEQRLRVLAALVDGNSERAAERMTEVSRPTVSKLAMTLGAGAVNLHNALAHDLALSLFELDEIWSYVGKKQARVTPDDGPDVGEAYTFVGLAMPSRFIAAWKVGKRDQETADAFTDDLRARCVVMPAMTSDGFAPYVPAIGKSFGPGVVPSGGSSAPVAPSPTPPVAPVAAAASAGNVEPVATPPGPKVDERQLDLLAWRPRPLAPSRRLPPGQLSLLFGIEIDSDE